METVRSINDFFAQQLDTLDCNDITKAYIVSVLAKFKSSTDDFSNESITIRYSNAVYRYNFAEFQSIADYLFFCNAVYPEHLNGASSTYYYSIGAQSYYQCYKMLNRSFAIYEQLADEFVPLSTSTRMIIQKL